MSVNYLDDRKNEEERKKERKKERRNLSPHCRWFWERFVGASTRPARSCHSCVIDRHKKKEHRFLDGGTMVYGTRKGDLSFLNCFRSLHGPCRDTFACREVSRAVGHRSGQMGMSPPKANHRVLLVWHTVWSRVQCSEQYCCSCLQTIWRSVYHMGE